MRHLGDPKVVEELESELGEQPAEPVEPAQDLVEMVLAEHSQAYATMPARIEGIVIGVLSGFGPRGEPLIDFAGNPHKSPIPARAMVSPGPEAVGGEVALMFEGGEPARPVLLGLIQAPVPLEAAPESPVASGEGKTKGFEVEADGERVVLSAEKEIVIRCGEASITLTRAGKILIRGAYLLARSSGVNRIQGGSVQIN